MNNNYVLFEVRNGRLYKETSETQQRSYPRISEEEMNKASISFNPKIELCGKLFVKNTDYLSGAIIHNEEVLSWDCVMFKGDEKSHIVWKAYAEMSDTDTFICYHIAQGDLEEAIFLVKHDPASKEEVQQYNENVKKLLA